MSEALIFDKYGKDPKTSGGGSRERVFSRLLLILVAALSLFLVGELVFHFLVAPRLTVRNILISSDLPLSKEEILSIAGAEENAFYYSVNPAEIREALEHLPMVREAAVEKVFPDQLHITLYGRIPLSMLFFTSPEGTSIPMVVDDQGVIFEIGTGISEWDLPVITGVQFKQLKVGMKLPEQMLSILQDLDRLRQEDPQVFRLISELRLIPKSMGTPEVLLYPLQYPVRLRLSGGLDAAVLRNASIILDLLARQELLIRVRELDMRTGEVVYRIEEE
ncbi:MAG: FtsQ-type POTRA domain-containing protein [Spirochaetaceae bacterium]|nr:MAG: FtsQ-type POTRA domain-containing protein [Spirochaetaceae bacterium]